MPWSLRRFFAPVLALVALLMFLPVVHAQQMVAATNDGVIMRSGAGVKYRAQWTVDKGYPMQIIASKGGWVRVRDFEGDTGWVARSRTNRQAHVVSKASVLNVRATGSTKARIVAKVSYGEVMRTLARQGDWVKVKTGGGQTGWVSRRLTWGF